MTKTPVRLAAGLRARWRMLASTGLALALSAVVLAWALDLRHAYFRVPFVYQGDAMFYHVLVKGTLDHGWFLQNDNLAAPRSLDLRDVPSSDNNFHFAVIKLLGWLAPSYPLVLNFFFLLSFPLTVVCALFALRQFGLSWAVAVAISLLYTFLPYHFTRTQHHLFLSSYWQLPLLMVVLLWLARDEFQAEPETTHRLRFRWRSGKFLFSAALCLLLGSSGYYYAFFACFLLLVTGVLIALRRRSWSGLVLPGILIALIGVTVTLNLWPSVQRFRAAGRTHFAQRLAGEADVYGLRLTQLLLPVRWHRFPALYDLKNEYNARPLINENDDASLGLIGALGFLGLLWWRLFRKPEELKPDGAAGRGLLDQLSTLNLAAVLLGTMGGFGSLIAFLGLPQVRAYNRLSIFIGFFALCAMGLWLDGWRRNWVRTRAQQAVFITALVGVVLVGLLDQISPRFRLEHQQLLDEYMSDDVFVRQIEAKLPPGAMVFQLPVLSFPENPKVHRMFDYDLARGYLHSKTLKWSYGTIKGRESDVWLRQVAARPTPELVETLAWAGFGGLYLDRFGYPDNGAKLEGELAELLGVQPSLSPNGRQAFFDLTGWRQRLQAQVPQSEWAARQQEAAFPILPVWQSSFSDLEGTPEDSWRWCGREGSLRLANNSGRAREFKLEMAFYSDNEGTVALTGDLINERVPTNRFGVQYAKTITLPPGEHAIFFHSDARRVLPPNDFRELVFRVRNFKFTPLEAAPAPTQSAPATAPTLQPTAAAKAAGR